MSESIIDQKKRIISAGKKAVNELIKIAEEPIINGRISDEEGADDELSADELTRAAQSKKIAIMDAFEILARCEQEEIQIESSQGTIKAPPTSWAESNAKASK